MYIHSKIYHSYISYTVNPVYDISILGLSQQDDLLIHEMTLIQVPINYVNKVNDHKCLMKWYKKSNR